VAKESVLTAVPVISIIDDDESIRVGLNYLVKSLGYLPYTFASAEAFLQSGQLPGSWCVIADVRMPTMSGIQLQSHLRSQGNQIPFIFITAVPEESTRKQALSEGAICFLTKPFDESLLISCLDTAVEQRRNSLGS
jgi:FixJ family two-component response regulator